MIKYLHIKQKHQTTSPIDIYFTYTITTKQNNFFLANYLNKNGSSSFLFWFQFFYYMLYGIRSFFTAPTEIKQVNVLFIVFTITKTITTQIRQLKYDSWPCANNNKHRWWKWKWNLAWKRFKSDNVLTASFWSSGND